MKPVRRDANMLEKDAQLYENVKPDTTAQTHYE